jgi:hypothetical protein
MGAPLKPPLALLALAMAHKAHELQLKRKRGRPRKTLLGLASRHWKKGKKRRRRYARRGRPPWSFRAKCDLIELLVEKRLQGIPTWKAALKLVLEEIWFPPSITADSLLRMARRLRQDRRVQAVVLGRHPSAQGLFFAPIYCSGV